MERLLGPCGDLVRCRAGLLIKSYDSKRQQLADRTIGRTFAPTILDCIGILYKHLDPSIAFMIVSMT